MKLALNVNLKGELKNGDIFVYRDGALVNIRKDQYFAEMNKKVYDAEQKVLALKQELEDFKNGVNEKLKQYHDILQVLTKE